MGDGIFSGSHLLIVAVIFVLLFGAAKLPIFARSLGQSMRIFKSEIKGLKDDDEVAAPPLQATTHVQQQPVIQTPAPAYVQQAPAQQGGAHPVAQQQVVTGVDGRQYVLQPVSPEQSPTEHR